MGRFTLTSYPYPSFFPFFSFLLAPRLHIFIALQNLTATFVQTLEQLHMASGMDSEVPLIKKRSRPQPRVRETIEDEDAESVEITEEETKLPYGSILYNSSSNLPSLQTCRPDRASEAPESP